MQSRKVVEDIECLDVLKGIGIEFSDFIRFRYSCIVGRYIRFYNNWTGFS